MTDLGYLKSLPTLKITISGDIGSGKSTFAKHLAADLGIERTYIGALMREEAARRGLTLDEFSVLQTTDDTVDRALDDMQRRKSQESQKGIFEGRTAWHFVENPTVKVFFKVDPTVAAERLLASNDPTRDRYTTIEEVMKANADRKAAENIRYGTFYGIDVYDLQNYDVVIDATEGSIDEVYARGVDQIATFLRAHAS